MLAHLVGPAFLVVRESRIEPLKEDGRIDVLVPSLLLEHLPRLTQLHAFDFKKVMKIKEVLRR